MKNWLILAVIITNICQADDCFYAFTASCNQESSNYKWAEINFVISTKFDKNRPKSCPDSAIVAGRTGMMLSEKGLVGKFCTSNEDFHFYTSESSPLAILTKNSEEAVRKSKELHEKCMIETYDERCATVNEFKSVSVQPYMER